MSAASRKPALSEDSGRNLSRTSTCIRPSRTNHHTSVPHPFVRRSERMGGIAQRFANFPCATGRSGIHPRHLTPPCPSKAIHAAKPQPKSEPQHPRHQVRPRARVFQPQRPCPRLRRPPRHIASASLCLFLVLCRQASFNQAFSDFSLVFENELQGFVTK